MFLKILLLSWILKPKAAMLISSLVADRTRQKGIYLDEYCPKSPFCEEGTHVMCMYYDPHREYGPNCIDIKNVSVTAQEANTFLEMTNGMRAKLAMGNEVGHQNEPLPRAYGMFKLQWDNELATFAQVLANQCVVRHDMCRGSKKFPNPGQTVGLIRFTSPDWFPAKTKKSVLKEPGLTNEKLMYAVTTAVSSWYSHKKAVTSDMISNYPDFSSLDAGKINGRLYLDTMYGSATHMGCGVSAFTYYTYYDDKSKLLYNVILVVCNYSEGPVRERSVYDLERRAQSSRCGCPPNAVEDENCLCTYVEDQTPENHCDGVDCEQSVILLPIFTVEDAPPSKLDVGRQIKQRSRTTDSMEILGAVFPGNKSTGRSTTGAKNEHPIVKVLNGIMNNEHLGKPVQQSLRAANRRIDNPSGFTGTNLYHKQSPVSSLGHVQPRKTSIFSRSVLFVTSKPNIPLKLTLKDFKKDVKRRKDFSKAKRLVNTYMEAVKNYTILKYKIHIPEPQDKISTDILNKAENDVIIYDTANDTYHEKHNEIENVEGDGDTKLMTLLDKLEEEVQHIELSGNKKELFDAKIRKIYDSVVGNPSGLPGPKHHIKLEDGVGGAIEKVIERTSREIETKTNKDMHIDDNFDIGKTIDEMVHNNHDEEHRIDVNENNDGLKKRPMRVKSRVDDGYNTDRDVGTDYELRKRENIKRNLNLEKLSGYEFDKEYKPYTFPEHRQSYRSKDQDGSYERFKMRYSADELGRRDKRLKNIREYFKNRNINSVENIRKKYYMRHHVTDDVDDDVMSPERRKYYQDRLENLKRKIYSSRIHKYRNEDTDHRRRALRLPNSDDEALRRPSKGRLEHFDMREKSRFIHAY